MLERSNYKFCDIIYNDNLIYISDVYLEFHIGSTCGFARIHSVKAKFWMEILVCPNSVVAYSRFPEISDWFLPLVSEASC